MTDHPGERYLGSGHEPAPDRRALTGPVPAHLPKRLAISLWDFSWYTQAGVGEAYGSLSAAMTETVERGYNAIRICAAPLLLFGGLGLDDLARDLPIEGLGRAADGGSYGRGTRWYDAEGGYRLDLAARFDELFDLARENGIVVILSSWEFQQSTSFAGDRRWFDTIFALDLAERYDALATATIAMLHHLDQRGSLDLVAFTELHNEVDFSLVPALTNGGGDAIRRVSAAFPAQIITASYGKPPFLDMNSLDDALQLAQFHIYAYGVLDALQRQIDIRSEGTDGFPNEILAGMLVDDAPGFAEYGRAADWKFDATVITDQQVYGYDWIDPDRWDLWLYGHYGEHRLAMRREIAVRIEAVTAWARRRGIPTVFGEGWVGYTPLRGDFEEGPVGKDLAELAIKTALANGAWGVVLTSNAAPHHPLWADVSWQQAMNRRVLATETTNTKGSNH